MSSPRSNDMIWVEGGIQREESYFTRNHWMKVTDVPGFRDKHQEHGLYISAYMYDKQNPNDSHLFGDFYLDFDDDDFEKVRKDVRYVVNYLNMDFTYNIPYSSIRFYFSGKKGAHLVIPTEVFDIKPDVNLNQYFREMAKELNERTVYGTIDTQIYDRRRLFRLPKTKHQSTGYYKTPLTFLEIRDMPLEDIKTLAEQPREMIVDKAVFSKEARDKFEKAQDVFQERFNKKRSKERFGSTPMDFTPHCIQELIDEGPQNGQRNQTACVLTSFWKRQGYSEEETWEHLVEWNDDSLDSNELDSIFQSIFFGDYEYGCSTLETLATCAGYDCPIYKYRADVIAAENA